MSRYNSYSHQGPPWAGPSRSPFVADEEEDGDYTSYTEDNSTSAYLAPPQQSNEHLRRRSNQVSNKGFADLNYRAPPLAEKRHFSTSTSPKSVRFSDRDDNSNINTSSIPATSVDSDPPTHARQRSNGSHSSVSSIASESLRRVSQTAEVVTTHVDTAVTLWTRSAQQYGPVLLWWLAVGATLLFALQQAPSIATESGGFRAFLQGGVEAWNRGQRKGALNRDVAFNITEQFGRGGGVAFEVGAWRVYEELLRDTEMETWFDQARAVDDVISALWTGLPPVSGVVVPETKGVAQNNTNNNNNTEGIVYQPITVTVTFPGGGGRTGAGEGKENKKTEGTTTEKMDDDKNQDENTKVVMRRLKMRSAIDMRSTMRKRAEAYFENFLAGRAVAIGRALAEARRFGELVESHVVAPSSGDKSAPVSKLIGPEFHADVATKFRFEPAVSGKKGMLWKNKFPEVRVLNRTNYILTYSGLHLPADLPADLKGQAASLFAHAEPNTLSALADLRRAEQAELAFLDDLLAQSAHSPALAAQGRLKKKGVGHATQALETLLEKMAGLERRLQSAHHHLLWVAERFEAQVAVETGEDFRPERSTGAGTRGGRSWSRRCIGQIFTTGLCGGASRGGSWSRAGGALWRSWRTRSGWWRSRGASLCVKGGGVTVVRIRLRRRPAAIGGKKEEKKKLKGWFWKKGDGEKEQTSTKEEGEEEAVQTEQKPLSGSKEDKFEKKKGDDVFDDTPVGRALRERKCCGYSAHNEWADLLMYGDKQFTYQDLYSGERKWD
ncbi:hypothetical protein PG994_002256 [Apiospora phragmitis]|uniref:Uncharacterized protein n=1 Tax=Apiospora phragmitis TaxID=2905665 RepID=A0ABR1WVX5_9PEZI